MSKDYNYTLISEVKPCMTSLYLQVIVLEIGKPTVTKTGQEVRTAKVADKSGSINLSVWNEQGYYLQPSDIIRIQNGYAGIWRGCLTLYTGKSGNIGKIGEFCLPFNEHPNFSEANSEYMSHQTAKQTNKNLAANEKQYFADDPRSPRTSPKSGHFRGSGAKPPELNQKYSYF